MATLLGSILVALGLDSGEFRSGLSDAEKSLKKTQKNMERVGANFQKVGAAMTLGVTAPLIAGAAAAVSGFQDQQKAMAQVNAALSSMGPVAGRTAQQLSDAADAMEMHSLVDADVILTKITANLLTFGNVSGTVFDRAQQAAVDMAQRLGSDPQAAAIMLGKALNDPVKGITALTRVGVSFSAAQIATIKAMAATGKTAAAQGLIMTEVERQFKGAAQAAADTSPWRQAQVAINQAGDTIGEALLPVIPPIANAIRDAALAFGSLSPQMQQIAIYSLGAAAALGPVLGTIGGVIGLVSRTLPFLTSLGGSFGAVATEVGVAGSAATGFGAVIGGLLRVLGPVGIAASGVYLAFQHWDDIKDYVSGVADRMNETKGDIDNWFKGLNDWARTTDERLGLPSQKQFTDSVSSQLSDLWANINQYDLQRWADGVDASIAAAFTSAVNSARNLYVGIKTWMQDKLGAVFSWVSDRAKQVGDAFFTLYDRVVGHSYVPDMVDEIGQHMARLDGNMVSPVRKATETAAQAFADLANRVQPLLDRLFPEQAKLNQFKKDMADLTALAAAQKWTPEQTDEAQRRLRNEARGADPATSPDGITEPVVAVWQAADHTGELISDTWGKIGAANDNMVESFANMARDVAGSLQGLVGNIKSGDWLGALSSVLDIIGQVSGILKGTGTAATRTYSVNAPSFPIDQSLDGARALGGPVLPRGSYLVGERGPEILRMGSQGGSIVPNHQIGSSTVEVHVVANDYFDAKVGGISGGVTARAVTGAQRNAAMRGRQSLLG
jgi:hypothetical protein